MRFSYNFGRGLCSYPPSSLESCTLQSRLVFQYQACANVIGSEMKGRKGSFLSLLTKRTKKNIWFWNMKHWRLFVPVLTKNWIIFIWYFPCDKAPSKLVFYCSNISGPTSRFLFKSVFKQFMFNLSQTETQMSLTISLVVTHNLMNCFVELSWMTFFL